MDTHAPGGALTSYLSHSGDAWEGEGAGKTLSGTGSGRTQISEGQEEEFLQNNPHPPDKLERVRSFVTRAVGYEGEDEEEEKQQQTPVALITQNFNTEEENFGFTRLDLILDSGSNEFMINNKKFLENTESRQK